MINADKQKVLEPKAYEDESKQMTDSLDKFKFCFKRYPKFYSFIVKVISPVYFQTGLLTSLVDSTKVQVEIGGGNTPIGESVINCDFFPYDTVDVVLDAKALPFQTNSVDTIFSVAVLEHVPNPEDVVKEMFRVLKPGGEIFTVIPFMQPYHASPNDYQRFTITGIKHLHRHFAEIKAGPFSGPVSGFLWVFQDFCATCLSFGNKSLHSIWFLIFMTLTFPFKYLDILLLNFKTADIVASSFYFHGRKS